jgi:hypothetical protein
MAITFCSELSLLTRSHIRIVCRGQERPKGSTGTLRPDSMAILGLDFLKSRCHHKIQEEGCKEIQV